VTEAREHELTQLLRAWSEGDDQALEKLVPLVYAELHRLARHYMAGERAGHTLQTSALVNEAYLRLVDVQKAQHWNSRGHFFAAAEAMRRILVDSARQKKRLCHGGGRHRADLQEAVSLAASPLTSCWRWMRP